MDAYEVAGQRTALRAYLLRAVEHVMGKPARMMSAPGVPITQIGALFELLNISMTPSQLQRLPMAAQTRHRDCLHFASVPRVRSRTHEDISESTIFSIDDLHWCVLQSLQSGRAHPHLRKLIEPFADKSGTRLYVPLAKLEAVWRSLQREELPASIRALASELLQGETLQGETTERTTAFEGFIGEGRARAKSLETPLRSARSGPAQRVSSRSTARADDESSYGGSVRGGGHSHRRKRSTTSSRGSGAAAAPGRRQGLSEGQLQWLLLSQPNDLFNPAHATVCQSMTKPLADYFIESSHNTYLTGGQLTSASDAGMYERVLLQGCRCIEVDCWDGAGGEPEVLHGHTLTSRISAESVFAAIARSAFVASPYPVLVSLELHLSPPQQERLAAICREALGDMLVYPKAAVLNMSPASLKGKVLLKAQIQLDVADEREFEASVERVSDEHDQQTIHVAHSSGVIGAPEDSLGVESSFSFGGVEDSASLGAKSSEPSTPAREASAVANKPPPLVSRGGSSKRSAPPLLHRADTSRRAAMLKRAESREKEELERKESEGLGMSMGMLMLPTIESLSRLPSLAQLLTRASPTPEAANTPPEKPPSPTTTPVLHGLRRSQQAAEAPAEAEPTSRPASWSLSSLFDPASLFCTAPRSKSVNSGLTKVPFLSNSRKKLASSVSGLIHHHHHPHPHHHELEGDESATSIKGEKSRPHAAATQKKKAVRVEGLADIVLLPSTKISGETILRHNVTAHAPGCEQPPASSSSSSALREAADASSMPFGVNMGDLEDCKCSSLKEGRAMRMLVCEAVGEVCRNWQLYNCSHLTRVYPDGSRIRSTNYDAFSLWGAGAQLVALNYQTNDRELQCARGFFRTNGGCGYVLKPEPLRNRAALLDASVPPPLAPPPTCTRMRLRLLCGRLLPKAGEEQPTDDAWHDARLPLHHAARFEPAAAASSPVVGVEVVGGCFASASADGAASSHGETWESAPAASGNGLLATWGGGGASGASGASAGEGAAASACTCEVMVSHPQLAVLRLAVYDGQRHATGALEALGGVQHHPHHKLVAFAALPCASLRRGVRCVRLLDAHGSLLPFSRLLVHLEDVGAAPLPASRVPPIRRRKSSLLDAVGIHHRSSSLALTDPDGPATGGSAGVSSWKKVGLVAAFK